MNANAKKWIEALKSGEYKRAVGRLRRTDKSGNHSYCCLGVACELYRQATGKGKWTERDLFKIGIQVEQAGLPPTVRKWLGISGLVSDGLVSIPIQKPNRDLSNLAYVNDCRGSSLKRVAATIEKNQDHLFRKD